MKLNFKTATQDARCSAQPRLPSGGARAGKARGIRHRRGVALIITLIMLSVITFMAITFLVLSQRQRDAAVTATDQLTAADAAASGQERGLTELMGAILAFTNDQNIGLIVSTNYINYAGFDPSALDYRTNVNYAYTAAGAPLTTLQLQQNIASLLYNPRVPVFVTNPFTGGLDFRYYLDLNRNGMAETNGTWPVIGYDPLKPYYDANGTPTAVLSNAVRHFFVGDPEWIGVPEFADRRHSSTNLFLARYAYLVVPAGKALDVNYIHNETVTRSVGPLDPDGFLRNQGIAPWEINLAALFVDLNTNSWLPFYNYRQPAFNNIGPAFDDARAFLFYRFASNYLNLDPARVLFPNNAAALTTDDIDDYSDGSIMLGTAGISENVTPPDNPLLPWAGSDNPNHFFTTQDFFDANKTSPAFVFRLTSPAVRSNSYDRYTYYRMLEQLGTDSAPLEDKINVNHVNVDVAGNIVPDMETNLIPWRALQFFTNAANRLLRMNTTIWAHDDPPDYFGTFGVRDGFGVTNIPVFETFTTVSNGVTVTRNVYGYTPAVHRLLQVVANIYDATTNRADLNLMPYPYLPHVYRPIFRRNPAASAAGVTNVFIAGFQEVVDTSVIIGASAAPLVDLTSVTERQKIPDIRQPIGSVPEPMVYGIPMVIGAKKGFPNFNKFALENNIRVTRKLFFRRSAPKAPVTQTNQMYSLAISNAFGMQAWNSYGKTFPRPLVMVAWGDVSLAVTNDFGLVIGANGAYVSNRMSFATPMITIPANTWTNFGRADSASTVSFRVPLIATNLFLTNSEYIQNGTASDHFERASPTRWDNPNTFYVPHWWLNTRSRIRFALIDTSTSPNRIVDYVNLDSMETPVNIMEKMQVANSTSFNTGTAGDPDPGILWQTNRWGYPVVNVTPDRPGTPTYGILNQIKISLGAPNVSDGFWKKYNANSATVNDKASAIEEFTQRLFPGGTEDSVLAFSAPFNPTRTYYQYIRWEANDPLVHYTMPDLTDLLVNPEQGQWDANDKTPIQRLITKNPLSDHYRPWGGNPNNPFPTETSPPTQVNTAVKDPDPLRLGSDHWDFPTNKLPNVGWLGRVHSGRPWQTIYMKSADAPATWQRWSGNTNIFDALNARPANDRLLFDVFTTAINQNATRGQLSINQDNLAAWSAVLSGVNVLTNSMAGVIGPAVIQPAGIYDPALPPPVAQIVQGINRTRAANDRSGKPRFLNRTFNSLGDILATPQLTEQSPFLTGTNSLASPTAAGINDEVLERIPQQIMSLLTLNHSPRFVIYSYGQALKPAPNSVLRSGPFQNMCTNYQVTAETATRAVVRVEGSPDPQYTLVPFRPDPYGRVYPPHIVIEQFNILPPD